jgi:predicted acyltransferase
MLTVSFLAITRSYTPVLFNDATLLAFVFGIPTLTGVFSWRIYKTHPIISVIGWLFTGFWFTCIAVVVGWVIALSLINHRNLLVAY